MKIKTDENTRRVTIGAQDTTTDAVPLRPEAKRVIDKRLRALAMSWKPKPRAPLPPHLRPGGGGSS